MTTTIAQAFQQLKTNINITSLQTSTVSTRQQNIRQVLDSGLTVTDSFLTGSYSRSTLIAPLAEADIDIFVVLDSQYFHNYNNQNGGPAGLLDLVKRTLRKTYTRTPDISRNGQAVTIRFDDFMVDIVPSFNRQGGGYLIPNSLTQSWISTDPKKHAQILSDMNSSHNNDLVPLIKMIKAWNKNNGTYFLSFHLEVLSFIIFNKVTISDYPSGMRFYFDKARDLVTKQNPDPAGYGGDVGYYLNTADKIKDAVGKLQLAYEWALKAEAYASQGNIQGSFEMWNKVFGNYFPSYR